MGDYHIFSSHLAAYEEELKSILGPTGIGTANGRLGEGAAPPEKCYFICFVNRSGSNLLAEALSRTKLMGCPGEIFNPEPVRTICAGHGLRSMSEYIDWQLKTRTTNGVFGAKAGIHQLAYLAKHGFLKTKFPNPGFVYITRQSLVLQAVSLHMAWQTGAWTSKAESRREPEFSQAGVASMLRSITETQAGFEAFFAAHGIEPLRLTYEFIESSPQAAMRQVCRLVGIERPMRVPLPKLTLQRQRTSLNEAWADRFMSPYREMVTVKPEGRAARASAGAGLVVKAKRLQSG